MALRHTGAMPNPSDWIEGLAGEAIDPARAGNALRSIAGVWPPAAKPLAGLLAELPGGAAAFAHLLSVSPVAARKLVRDPEALLWLARPGIGQADRGPRRMRADLEALRSPTATGAERLAALRRLKQRETLRVALREVAGLASLEATTLELTHLAELCLREVCSVCWDDLTQRWGPPGTEFAVLGFGKLGGHDLNYSSDIDVVFLFGEEGMVRPNLTRQEFFSRLAEKIVAAFSANHPAGPLFRIDLRLRPEGASGPLVRSLESTENYYAGFGETWERMALMKARGVAGDEELAYEFCQRLQPFIYPRSLSADLLDEVATIKGRLEREIVGAGNLTRNVKLGYGGIREIEFVVGTLQLLHAARHAFLQERNTLRVLRGLSQLDLLPAAAANELAAAYRFLRTVEHRLQIEEEAQTHTLPDSPAAVRRLAASLGVADLPAELARHTDRVRAVFDRFLRAEERETAEPVAWDLARFAAPEQAAKTLDQLAGTAGPAQAAPVVHVAPRTRRAFVQLAPVLLAWLGRVADPDAALARFAGFVERYGIRGLLYESLVLNPRLLELLVRLFDASRFLADIVLRRPQLIEDVVRQEGALDCAPGIAGHLQGLLTNDEGLPWGDWARVYRRSQILRIGLRDVLGLADLEEVQAEYSALAEACALFVGRQLGVADGLTVVAMGKFGGRELSYGCDLDVVLVGDDPEPGVAFIKEFTATTAEGILFPVDVRLRPEGTAGMLVIPLAAYGRYFQTRAQFWEAQALTKARPLTGPDAAAFGVWAQETWRRFGARPTALAEVKAMHERVLRQRSGGAGWADFKTGPGGLMDIEFAVQALQMTGGIWENNTLRAMARVGLPLRDEYLFLRRVEAVLRRVENSGVSVLPADDPGRERLARRTGFATAEEFAAAYTATRERAAAATERVWARAGSVA